MVRRLEQPLEVLLFFPRANDVLQKVERYFAALEGGDQIKVSLHDRLLEPELAKKHKVVQEGSVVLKSGDSSRLWQVGAKASTARSRLEKARRRVSRAVAQADACARKNSLLGDRSWRN